MSWLFLVTSESSASEVDCTGFSVVDRKSHSLIMPLELPVKISFCEVKTAAFKLQLSASESAITHNMILELSHYKEEISPLGINTGQW